MSEKFDGGRSGAWMNMISLNLPTIEQARAVRDALEIHTRLTIGQMDAITGMVRDGTIPLGGRMGQGERELASLEQIEQVEALVNQIKSILGYPRNGSNGVGNSHVHPSGHRAYEAMKVLAKAIAVEVNPNPGFRGVDYDGLTVRYTQDPAPTATAGQGGASELESLRAFAQAVMEAWPMGGLDGGDLQATAEKHGLLKSETRYEPCGEGCSCAEYADAREFADGVTCYRKTALLKGGARAPTAWLIRSKTGLIRTAWAAPPTEAQVAAAEADGDTIQPVVESMEEGAQADAPNAFNDAINFALMTDQDGLSFLSLWREGDWDAIKNEFPKFDLSSSRAAA